MKTILLKILNYIYRNRESVYSIYNKIKENKNIKIDWKISPWEVIEYIDILSRSWLVINKEDDEKIYFWAIDSNNLKENTSKNLVQYEQSSWSCVIYAWARSIMYNSSLVFTADEIEQVKNMAKVKWKWIDGVWMTFRDWGDIWREWLKINKGVDMIYDRVFYNTPEYHSRKEKGYSNVCWGYMSTKYVTDFKIDWNINQSYTFTEKKRFWHCWTEQDMFKYTDNYPNTFPYNSYTNNKYKEFVDNEYFFRTAYFAFIDEPIKEDFSFPSLDIAIKNWLISDSELDKPVTRKELWIVAGRIFSKLNK